MSKQQEALRLALEALEICSVRQEHQWHGLQKMQLAEHAIREALAEQPEFFTHSVEQPYDWSEWVCPDPKSYLMKCCGCGLVHEAQFGVVRYKSETEREDCDMVDEPNLQAVFRMRRNEQWSPEDTAHRAGGLPMAEQPAQQQCPHDFLMVDDEPWHDSVCMQCGAAVPNDEPAQQQELEELTAQRDQLADILTRTANALKGQPAELSLHSWHDLPEVAQQLKEKNNG